MIGPVPSRQAAEQFLSALQAELSGLGVSCDLRDDGGQLRLGVFFDDEAGGDLFDNVAVARFHGAWWYCWPQMTPICAVGSVTGAAQAILGELDVRDEDDVADVADLNVFRVLRLARLSDPPGPQPADSAQTHPLTPEGTRTADRCTGPAVAVYWDFENLHAGLLDEAGGPGAYRAAWHGPQEPIADIGAVAE